MPDTPQVTELEHQVADAELGVAEELGWAVAGLAALAVHIKWESWLVTLAAGGGAYALAIYRYRKRAVIAEDKYHRAAGLGKYTGGKASTDV